MKIKKKIIKNPFLNDYEIIFAYGTYNELHKFSEKYYGKEIERHEDSPGVHRYQYNSGIICIHSDNKYADNQTIIHEITHAVQRLLNYLNIDSGINNTELVANLMAYYLKEALIFYKLK